MNKLFLLQSGFITPYEIHLNKNLANQRSDVNTAVKLTSSVLPDEWTENYYSPTVDLLFREFISTPKRIESFQFKDGIFNLALGLFLKEGLVEFIVNQSYSNYVTDRHFSFLEDVVKFILTGEQSVSMINWVGLVKLAPSTLVDRKIDFERVISRNTDLTHNEIKESFKLLDKSEELVLKWINQPGGIEHLLITMKIIFGNSNRPLVGS